MVGAVSQPIRSAELDQAAWNADIKRLESAVRKAAEAPSWSRVAAWMEAELADAEASWEFEDWGLKPPRALDSMGRRYLPSATAYMRDSRITDRLRRRALARFDREVPK